MKRLLFHSIFLFCALAMLQSQTVEQRLIPVDDTYTYSDNTIRGMEPLLKTYHSTAGSQFRRISFLKFDISGLSPFVQSVKLRLYCNGFPAGGDLTHQFDLYPVAKNTWAEDDVTFVNYVDRLGADITSPLLASYTVPAGQALSAQYIEFSGAALTKYIADSLAAGRPFISFRMREKNVVKVGSSAVIVEFHSKENTSEFAPEMVVAEKDVETLRASGIAVNGLPLVSFNEAQYRYLHRVPWNSSDIPVVTATAKYQDVTVNVEQAVSLTGTETQRTARVILQKGTDQLIYYVAFELLPPPTDARLSSISVDGEAVEFFDKEKNAYKVYLPYSQTASPVITAQAYDPEATVQIVQAVAISETASEADRTALLTVTSANGQVQKSYQVVLEKLPMLDIVLAIGQSNMSGRAPFANVSDPMTDVYLLTPAGQMEVSSNPMNKYSNIRKDISVQGLGPSYTCALTLRDHLKKPVGFVVNAQGGSSITTWYQPGKSNYDATIKRAKEAQRFGRFRAIIWHQGSSDNSAGLLDNFASYKLNLAKMVQNLRTDLNEPNLFFVLGELSERTEFDQFSANVVQPVASYLSNSDYIVTDGTNLLPDGIHFDAASNILLGERYAEKIIEGAYNTTQSDVVYENEVFARVKLTRNKLTLQNVNERTFYTVFDITGKSVYSTSLTDTNSVVLTIEKGIYVVSFRKEGRNQQVKIIVS